MKDLTTICIKTSEVYAKHARYEVEVAKTSEVCQCGGGLASPLGTRRLSLARRGVLGNCPLPPSPKRRRARNLGKVNIELE